MELEEIEKSPNDKLTYKSYELLDNKLKIIFISDPSTHTSGATMKVKVGSFWDPHSY